MKYRSVTQLIEGLTIKRAWRGYGPALFFYLYEPSFSKRKILASIDVSGGAYIQIASSTEIIYAFDEEFPYDDRRLKVLNGHKITAFVIDDIGNATINLEKKFQIQINVSDFHTTYPQSWGVSVFTPLGWNFQKNTVKFDYCGFDPNKRSSSKTKLSKETEKMLKNIIN